MKQLSSSELNNLSKQDLIAMMLQMQQQMNILAEKLAIANARFLGRSTEKPSTLPRQMSVFNEAEAAAAEPIVEPVHSADTKRWTAPKKMSGLHFAGRMLGEIIPTP